MSQGCAIREFLMFDKVKGSKSVFHLRFNIHEEAYNRDAKIEFVHGISSFFFEDDVIKSVLRS